jgi:hypothetical protein
MGFFYISLETANRFYTWGWRLSVLGAVLTAVGVGFLMWGTRVRDGDFEGQIATLHARAAESEERASGLAIALEKARAETARADANLLAEQRLTARERMRLERLERIVLPRSIMPPTAAQMVEALKSAGFNPINIAIVSQRESSSYGFDLQVVLQTAGILGGVTMLPKESRAPSFIVLAVDDEGERVADFFFQKFQMGQGWRARILPARTQPNSIPI